MKRYRVGDFYRAIDSFAPFSLAMDFDNCGLLIGSTETEVRGALIALDATAAVVEEAAKLGANLLITHHPLIFHPLKRVEGDSVVYKLIGKGQSLIAAHTNLDIAPGGVNDVLAAKLGLSDLQPLEVTGESCYRKLVAYVPEDAAEAVLQAMGEAGAGRMGHYADAAFVGAGEGRFTPLRGANPAIGRVGEPERVAERRIEMLVEPGRVEAVVDAMREVHPYEEPAYDILSTEAKRNRDAVGRVGSLDAPLSPQELALRVRERLEVGGVRLVAGRERKITRVAVCGGAGGDYVALAVKLGAQALVTGEAKHNALLEAQHLGLTLIDAGHHCTEAVAMPALRDRLLERLPDCKLTLSRACGDPVEYL